MTLTLKKLNKIKIPHFGLFWVRAYGLKREREKRIREEKEGRRKKEEGKEGRRKKEEGKEGEVQVWKLFVRILVWKFRTSLLFRTLVRMLVWKFCWKILV